MEDDKYLLLIFKASGRSNYSNEALVLLSQYYVTLPPYLAEKLIWSRFINLHGLPGHNISCDLHMEHLFIGLFMCFNRTAKAAIQCLGANKSKKAIIRVGKSPGSLLKVLNHFDRENKVELTSGHHTQKKASKDLATVIQQLVEANVLSIIRLRRHENFPNFTANTINMLKEENVKEWMLERFGQMIP